MKYRDFYNEIDKYAPFSLSDKLCERDGAYDNSGMILPTDKDINKVLCCLDLTKDSAGYAAENGYDLVLTHHPAIYGPIKKIDSDSALYLCMTSGIGVISAHLNLDCAKYGIDRFLAEGLGGKIIEIVEDFGNGCGYGRISVTDGTRAGDILAKYKKEFSTDKVWLYGSSDAYIGKIASFCGAGLDETALDAVKGKGIRLLVSADVKHHVLTRALDEGYCVLCCTHYACENYGLKKFYEYITKKIKGVEIGFYDDERFV